MHSSFGEIYKLGGDHLPTSTITLKESGNKLVVSAYHSFNLLILQGVWSPGVGILLIMETQGWGN